MYNIYILWIPLVLINNTNNFKFRMQIFLWYPSAHPWRNKLEIKSTEISTARHIGDYDTWNPNTNHTNQCVPMHWNIMNIKLLIRISEKYGFGSEIEWMVNWIDTTRLCLKIKNSRLWNLCEIFVETSFDWCWHCAEFQFSSCRMIQMITDQRKYH